jgi:CBS domain-containing protein
MAPIYHVEEIMRVEEIMSRPFITCSPDETRDVCMAAYTRGLSLSRIKAGDVMSRDVYTVERAESVDAAERVMSSKQVRRLPVVDERGAVVGVVSLGDIAREAEQEIDLRDPDVDAYGVTHTLGTICAPRQPVAIQAFPT